MARGITVTPIPSFEDMRPLGNGLFEVTGTVTFGNPYTTGGEVFTLIKFGLVSWATWHFEPMNDGSDEIITVIPNFSTGYLEIFQMSDGAEEGAVDNSGIDFPFRITGYVT